MPPPIQFFFDFSSPYGYFASEKIEAIAARHGRGVEWRPVLLGAIFKVTGGQPLPQLPIKGAYYKHDFARSARLLDIPYRFPSVMPISSVIPSRAFYWVNEQDVTRAKEFAKRLYRAYFVDDLDISRADSVLSVATTLGIDVAAVESGLSDPQIKQKLKDEVQTAMDKGVFGSPHFLVDGEPFHGSDRLDQVDKWLAKGGW
jgi:2-hydroxychromene-2-carboxylate isomerase